MCVSPLSLVPSGHLSSAIYSLISTADVLYLYGHELLDEEIKMKFKNLYKNYLFHFPRVPT